jgi:hypothetical protein
MADIMEAVWLNVGDVILRFIGDFAAKGGDKTGKRTNECGFAHPVWSCEQQAFAFLELYTQILDQ